MEAKTLSREYINKHPYFNARRDSYRLSSGKIVDPYYVVELPPCVMAMALTENNEVLMVKQYRHPIGETILELPGGFIDAGETPETSISRELLEETGYAFDSFHYLGKIAANPGILSNFTHMFLAKGGKKVSSQILDANEEIEIFSIPLNEVRDMLLRNEIVQAMHVVCLYYGFRVLDGSADLP